MLQAGLQRMWSRVRVTRHDSRQDTTSLRQRSDPCSATRALLTLLMWFCACSTEDAIVYVGASSGLNPAIPTDGTAGALVIPKPAGVTPGMALIASIAARPQQQNPPGVSQGVVWTPPPGWNLMTSTNQPSGGLSTLPQGMTLLTYYRIAGTSEPNSYTWTFVNNYLNQGGSAVGGILAFSGVDTSSSPIDVWSQRLTASGLTHGTTSITTTVANTMIVSSISYLSGSSFANPTGIAGITERLDVRAPAAANVIGTTLQMATVPWAATGATGATQAVAAGNADTGVGHLMALKPSLRDLTLAMSRSGPLVPSGTASYTITVTNVGSLSEPGPLSIVDTLPTGLTYASLSGAGWSCSVAAQVLTCTNTGALAAGAAATPLVIHVNVAASANGVLANTATVSGTGGDFNLANNTATDTYVLLPNPYAYYQLDETAGANSFTDASGNGRNASPLGTATTTGNPPGSGAAIPGSPGTCGAASIPSGTTAIGINTAIDVNNIGNAGTIAFWYRSNTAWNDRNSRMLFDASNDLGNPVLDKHFFLIKDGSGSLRFALEDTSDTDSRASSVAYNFAANVWHHIAVTWDLPANRLYIYLDGDTSPVASSVTASNGVLGNMASLYFGAQHMTKINGIPAGYTANTANGYMDEIRLYNRALTPLEIEALADLVHACAATVDHYELSLPTSSIACLPTSVIVTACADASSPCSNRQGAVNGKTANLATSAGTLLSPVVFDSTGIGGATLSYPAAVNGTGVTVTLSGEQTPATNPRKCCPDGINCVAANSCATIFNTAGFIFSTASDALEATVPDQIAGVNSAPYWLRAVKTNTSTKSCEAAFTSPHPVTFTYQCINPAACSSGNLLSVGGSAIGSGGTSINLSFDANGNASLGSFNFLDVGKIGISATATAAGATLSGTVKGTGGSGFVVKPYAFVLTDIRQTAAPNTANPGAADASGGAFVRAGENFSVTVSAVNAACAAGLSTYTRLIDIPAACISRNFGKESTPESVMLSRALASGLVDLTNNPALGNPAAFGSFNNGSASNTTLNWGEAGIITLTPSIGDGNYLGAGDTTGIASGKVGRFYPDHFAITASPPSAGCGTFTYFGQDGFTTPFTLTAQNSANTTTQNYTGSFAKLGLSTWSNFAFTTSPALPAGSTLSGSATAPSGTWNQGVASVSAKHQISRPSALTGETSITLFAQPRDSDGVTMVTASAVQTASTPLRYGRLWLGNAYGSERNDLSLPYETQYWNGSAFLRNALDGCTALSTANVGIGNYQGSVNGTTLPAGSITLGIFSGGAGTVRLAAPNAAGSVDVVLRLDPALAMCPAWAPTYPAGTARSATYLRGKWCGAAFDRDAVARATFGIYNTSTNRQIYLREGF